MSFGIGESLRIFEFLTESQKVKNFIRAIT